MPQTCDLTPFEIMDWTVLPVRIAAKAWTNPVFRQDLLADPTPIIRAMAPKSCQRLGPDVKFQVYANTESVRHYPLPSLKPSLASLPQEVLKQKVEEETAGLDQIDDYWLPASVVFRSLVDAAYRARLLADANSTLTADGFAIDGFTVAIHENTATLRHLTLPLNDWADEHLDYDALVEKATNKMCARPH